MIVRRAAPADRPGWLRLRCALWPGADAEHERETRRYFTDGAQLIDALFVAELEAKRGDAQEGDDALIGFLEASLRSYAEGSDADRVPYVEGWYVASEHRRRGVGAALVDAAADWARSLGYQELASDAQADNAASIAAHRALGFEVVEESVCFLKSLEATGIFPETGRAWESAPVLGVRDVDAAARFFQDRLGFEIKSLFEPLPEEGAVYAIVARGGAELHLQLRRGEAGPGVREHIEGDAYLRVPDADALRADLLSRGAKLHRDITDSGYGMRDFVACGPEHLRISFGSRLD